MRNKISLWPEGGSERRSPRLDILREEIDGLDDALLELVERRLALSLEIAALKDQDDGRLKLRPRREADIVRRLTARGRLASPALIEHLWRELMSHSLQVQSQTSLALWGNLDPQSLREQVRERFGWAAPIVWSKGPADALERACRDETIAVIEHSPFSHWWEALADEPSLGIFDTTHLPGGEIGAFIVGRIAPEDISSDRIYRVLDEQALSERLERGEKIEVLAANGALSLCHFPPEESGMPAPPARPAPRSECVR